MYLIGDRHTNAFVAWVEREQSSCETFWGLARVRIPGGLFLWQHDRQLSGEVWDLGKRCVKRHAFRDDGAP